MHESGVHAITLRDAGPGTRYRYSVDGAPGTPDPRSRFQPEGVHGPSEVIDLHAFPWTDTGWAGLANGNVSIYELHVGTYTPEGTFAALTSQLATIRDLGVRIIEVMPIADFPGSWNWGYDGVDLYAPSRAYGRPQDLQRLVDEAHRLGLAIILDVVYNHLGPDGNYLKQYARDYFTDRHQTPWGEGINYDGPGSRFVRDFVIDNAVQWVREYHFDGLRLDATDTIRDDSDPHILRELQQSVRAAVDRDIVLFVEEARNDVRPVSPVDRGGYGFDAVWADDFHHEMRVFLSNAWEDYYADFTGTMDGVAKALNEGFIYQGQYSKFMGRPRGTTVTDEPASAFVIFLQNHDQVGNRPYGERLHHQIDRERFLVASALLLLGPETPLIFMGQEFAASTPFLFFTDHHEELGRLVTEGRRKEFGGFRAFAGDDAQRLIPDPQSEATFVASRLRLDERDRNQEVYRFYQRLLELRHRDPAFQSQDRATSRATVLNGMAIALHRHVGSAHALLVANFGHELVLPLAALDVAEPLGSTSWNLILSSTAPEYGGDGLPATITQRDGVMLLTIPARTAALFGAEAHPTAQGAA
jgi:maltooligosyltrehalose trehalohydrolase